MKRVLSEAGFWHAQRTRRGKWLAAIAVLVAVGAMFVVSMNPQHTKTAFAGMVATPVPPDQNACDPNDPSCPCNTPTPTPVVEVNVLNDPNAVLDPATQAVLARKQQLVNEYAQVGNGTLSISQYNADLDAFLNSYGVTDTSSFHPDHVQTSTDCAGISSSNLRYAGDGTCYDTSEGTIGSTATRASFSGAYPYAVKARYRQRILWNVPQVSQQNFFYCGPATAQEIISYWYRVTHTGLTSKVDPTDSLSQARLASTCEAYMAGCDWHSGKYLATDYWAGTNWNWKVWYWRTGGLTYHYPMQRGLNRWRQNNEFGGDYVAVGSPVATIDKNTLHDNWITDIDSAFPLVFDVNENTNNSSHLPGHPSSRPIAHWFAVRGYSTANYYGDGREYVHYVDSAYGAPDLSDYTLTQGNQKVSFDDVYGMIAVLGFGYVW